MLEISANQSTIQVYEAQCMLDILICRHFFGFTFNMFFIKEIHPYIHEFSQLIQKKNEYNLIFLKFFEPEKKIMEKMEHFYFYSTSFQPNSLMEFHVIFLSKQNLLYFCERNLPKLQFLMQVLTIFFPGSMQIVHLTNLNKS